MMCIDWEIQELYRREGYNKTRQKALDWMSQRDLYFMVGTTWRSYRKAWMIIGLIYPPKIAQQQLAMEPPSTERLQAVSATDNLTELRVAKSIE